MRLVRALVVILLVAVPACGGVREAIRDHPPGIFDARSVFDPRELVDVLPYGRIPAIERPRFESPAQASEWLGDSAPVAVLTIGTDARAYPLAILLWHEVVDDVVGGTPVVVTYAPLTGTTLAFERGEERFRVSGKLYRSGLVMADRRTRSLWPQLLGRAVAGPAKGDVLRPVPVQVASFAAFKASFPAGSVLSRETGVVRAYGATPYAGYLARTAPFPSFFAPKLDSRLAPMTRVVGFPSICCARAYPIADLMQAGVVIEDELAGEANVIFWHRGMRSAIDTPALARGRDVGSATAFRNSSSAGRLDFEATADGFRDRNTGSTWTVLGVATGGPLKGERLTPLLAVDAFWFAWAGFHPRTGIAGS